MDWEPVMSKEDEAQLKREILSDATSHQRWATEIQKDDDILGIFPKDFIERHKNRVRALNKFPALGFFTDKRIYRLERRRRIIMTLAKNAGLKETAEEAALDTLMDINMSRGWEGAYSKINVTERHEHKIQETKSGSEKIRGISRLFGKKDEQEEEQ